MSKDNWSAADYHTNAPFVYSQAAVSPILGLLNAQPGERILDLGCGSGELDVQLAQAVGENGFVLATDASQNMIETAKSSFGNIPNLEFRIEDAARLSSAITPTTESNHAAPGHRQFDAVFTNAALHWILRQAPSKVDVFKAVHALLSPPPGSSTGSEGGRFVGEFGGALNCVGIRSAIWRSLRTRGYDAAALDQWYFPGVEEFTQLLEDAGFAVREIAAVPRPTTLPNGVYGFLKTFFVNNFLNVTAPASREDDPAAYAKQEQIAEEIMHEVENDLEIDMKDSFTGKWNCMYVRLRFVAVARSVPSV